LETQPGCRNSPLLDLQPTRYRPFTWLLGGVGSAPGKMRVRCLSAMNLIPGNPGETHAVRAAPASRVLRRYRRGGKRYDGEHASGGCASGRCRELAAASLSPGGAAGKRRGAGE